MRSLPMPEEADPNPAFEVAARGAFIVPTPLVSRGRPMFDASGALASAAGSVPGGLCWAVASEGEAWIAVHVGVGPARLLVRWSAAAPSDVPATEAAAPSVASNVPVNYRIESSASSSRGGDGEWRLEQQVAANAARSRAHVIEFDGQSWVRLTFEGADAARSIVLERFDLHDATNGTDDVWLVLGDELAGWSLGGGADRGGVPELVNERYPGYYPALIDEAREGEAPSRTLGRLDELLRTHAVVKHVALAYGARALRGADERASLEALVSALRSRDVAVVVGRPPLPALVSGEAGEAIHRALRELETRHCLLPGPDLNQPFNARGPDAASTGREPAPIAPALDERRALRQLWVEALDALYVPQ